MKQWLAPNTKLRRILAGGCASLDGVEEADELLMTVALHVAADDFAAEHIQRGEQRGRAVPLTVMRHSRAPRPWAIAQPAPLGQTRGKDSTNNWYKVRAQINYNRDAGLHDRLKPAIKKMENADEKRTKLSRKSENNV